jgi:hypothetical protein
MVIRDILNEFTETEVDEYKKRQDRLEKKKKETEELLDVLHKCFEGTVLPVVNEAVGDLKTTGYYHKLEVGQATSLESGKQYTRDITLYFFPTIIRDPKLVEVSFIREYRLFFSAAKGYRGIKVSTKIGKDEDYVDLVIHKVNNSTVESFIRKFIEDAIADFKAY